MAKSRFLRAAELAFFFAEVRQVEGISCWQDV
jgi:hypothetical protein